MAKTWFGRKQATPHQQLLFEQERAVLLATEEILRLMEREYINKTALAESLGKSKAYITQALSGGRNMTLRTLAEFAWACGYAVRGFYLVPIGKGHEAVVAEGRAPRVWWVGRERVRMPKGSAEPAGTEIAELAAAA